MLSIEITHLERSPDHEMLEAHRQFVRLLRLSKLIHNSPGLKKGRLFRRTKREAQKANPILKRHGIEIEVLPAKRVLKRGSHTEPNYQAHLNAG